MSFHKKVDFLQQERDELPNLRPVIIYVVAPVYSKDYSMRTSLYKHFQSEPSSTLPEGVLKREGNPYHFCLIEANPNADRFSSQLSAALDSFKDAAYKVVVLNGHGFIDGVLMKEEGDTKEFLTGRHFAELAVAHLHGHHIHAFALISYGHIFASSFSKFCHDSTHRDTQQLVAISFFTSEESPNAWSRAATTGNAHMEIRGDIREFLHDTIEPNSPYKVLEPQLLKAQCSLL